MSQPTFAGPTTRSDSPSVAREHLKTLALWGLYLHVALLPISIAGMQVGLMISTVSLVALALMGERVWLRSELDVPILTLLGVVLFWPWDGGIGTKIYRTFLSPLIIFSVLGLSWETARRDALRLLFVWAAFALVPSLLAWFQHFKGLDLLHELGMRGKAIRPRVPLYRDRFAATGFFSWYIRLAHNLTPPLCLLAAISIFGGVGRRGRIFGGVAVALIAAAIFLTFTRTAWYGLAVAALLIAAFHGRRALTVSLVIMAVATTALLAFQPGFRARVASSLSGSSNKDRIGIWKTCQAVVDDHPYTGIGFGNMPTVGLPYFEEVAPRTKIKAWCHNTFFTAYVEGGALYLGAAALLWIWMGIVFFRLTRRSDRLGRAAAAGGIAALAAMGVNAMAHDIFYSSETMYGFGFLLALALVLAKTGVRSEEPAAES